VVIARQGGFKKILSPTRIARSLVILYIFRVCAAEPNRTGNPGVLPNFPKLSPSMAYFPELKRTITDLIKAEKKDGYL
jgi:hypothetical protein